MPMDCLDHWSRYAAGADVRLVRSHDQEIPATVQRVERLGHTGQQFELIETFGRMGLAAADDCAVDDAVSVEEDGAVHALAGPATDSHFARWTASAGCDTRQCQTTAWNASASGVTSSRSMVGTTMTSSPTCCV